MFHKHARCMNAGDESKEGQFHACKKAALWEDKHTLFIFCGVILGQEIIFTWTVDFTVLVEQRGREMGFKDMLNAFDAFWNVFLLLLQFGGHVELSHPRG